jgi:hypothetical protein
LEGEERQRANKDPQKDYSQNNRMNNTLYRTAKMLHVGDVAVFDSRDFHGLESCEAAAADATRAGGGAVVLYQFLVTYL